MNVSTSKPVLSLALYDVKPVRSGSLPFKKRRFPRLSLSELRSNEADDNNSTLASAATDAESLAALALVAAAATPKDTKAVCNTRPEERTEPAAKHGFSVFYQQAPPKSPANTSALSSALLAAASELQSLHDRTDMDATSTTKKANRPPLTKPLPNGCHGRTARHNSFCRRQPYNGSHFCKAHYQSLVLSGAVTEQELKDGKIVDVQGDMSEDISGVVGGVSDGVRISGTAVHHQDKRFTGAPSEIRCKATTTRGRDCSYCAVNSTKYCHLHATFDTNPPPRRGGAGYANASKAKESAGGAEVAKCGLGTAKSGKSGKADGPKRRNSSMSARRLSTTKNLEKHMAHAPYPLLSTLPTDKWLNTKVIISTGPLTNHVGLVEKWGNGWISVRLPGVGLHNRRSFELYLHPNPDAEGDSNSSANAEAVASRVEVFDASKEEKKTEKLDLLRVASTEEGASLTPMSRGRPIMRPDTVHEVTPLTSCRVIGIEQSLPKGNGAVRRVSSIMFPSCFSSSAPATVPESPVPGYVEAEIGGPHKKQPPQIPKAGSKDDNEFNLAAKPPVEAEGNDIPLVQSLVLAKERGSTKSKLGLLFGTAALDRSRRNIHKPKRYEDTELVSKKPKKRDRDWELDGPAKRPCEESSSGTESTGSTTMISSSDEEPSDLPVGMVSV